MPRELVCAQEVGVRVHGGSTGMGMGTFAVARYCGYGSLDITLHYIGSCITCPHTDLHLFELGYFDPPFSKMCKTQQAIVSLIQVHGW